MAKQSMSPRQRMIQRSIVILVVIVLGFSVCVGSLVKIQIFQADKYKSQSEQNQLHDTEIAAQRGIIYDRNNKILAQSASVWRVFIRPHRIPEAAREEVALRLSELLENIGKETVFEKAKLSGYEYLSIKRRVELDEKNAVNKLMEEKFKYVNDKGEEKTVLFSSMIGIDPDVKRYYPYSNFASSVIGFTGDDDVGRYGLELQYNDLLTGISGRRITAQNGKSELMPLQYETIFDAVQGTSLVLTIDEVIQRYLEKALNQALIDTKAKAGVYGIVMDVKTGAILAMSSKQDYDLNNPQKIVDSAIEAEIQTKSTPEERRAERDKALYNQWRNKAISDTYEPGSVFKVVVAAAALEENVYDMNRVTNCTGSVKIDSETYRCHNRSGHGAMDFTQGMMNSCNPVFIAAGNSLGKNLFFKYFEAFGFTEKTNIDLPGEASPVSGKTYHALEKMTRVNLSSSSFGQTFQVSPIQMIAAVSAIGNGGKLMQPYLIQKTMDEGGNVLSVTQPTVKRQVISETTASKVAEMMYMVCKEGTGKNGYVAGYNVAGKTGTSQKLNVEGEYIASFCGFAPKDDPEIAILIVIDEPVGQFNGGQVAAPVAAKVIEDTLIYLNVEPEYSEEEVELLNTTTPNAVGRSVQQAKNELDKSGFVVQIVGSGKNVVSQIPSSGQSIPKNGVIVLYTQPDAEKETIIVPELTGLSISQATKKALAAGLNIKISGNMLKSAELISFRQEFEYGTEVERGKTITVYFKSNVGVNEYAG